MDPKIIIVTGAGGKTGKAVVKALATRGKPVHALVHRPEQGDLLMSTGAHSFSAGDIQDSDFLKDAFRGGQAVYHICSNMNPAEVSIAEKVIEAARSAGVEHFVYHSVLHSQIEAMPHHWLKMRVEECLFTSGLAYTILQPGPYMQNVLAYWDSINSQGIYAVPYSVEARLSIVDIDDVAQAAAKVICEPGHNGAIYELAGVEPLSQVEVAEALSGALGRPVVARSIDRAEWEKRARTGKMNSYVIDTLLKMFAYYDHYGLVGCSKVLEWLLERPARRFEDFINKATADIKV